MAQRVQDDDDHRLRVCGLLPDEQEDQEREDFESRHHDQPSLLFAPRATLVAYPAPRRDAPGTQAPPRTRAGRPLQSVPPGREAEWAAAESTEQPNPPGAVGSATASRSDLNWERFAWQPDMGAAV
jgi:hypothetical protein